MSSDKVVNEFEFNSEIHREITGLRWLLVSPPAITMVLLLLWGMANLIQLDELPKGLVPKEYSVPDPVMPSPEPIITQYERLEPPPPVEVEPQLPTNEANLDPISKQLPIAFAPPTTDTQQVVSSFAADLPVALTLVQPNYPAGAANKSIEGFVEVQFDVTPLGTTDNIVILDSQPQGVFEKETLKAVKRWKFSPVIEEGKPMPYKGMTQRISFTMAKSNTMAKNE
jgi:periplasmic protein TonB